MLSEVMVLEDIRDGDRLFLWSWKNSRSRPELNGSSEPTQGTGTREQHVAYRLTARNSGLFVAPSVGSLNLCAGSASIGCHLPPSVGRALPPPPETMECEHGLCFSPPIALLRGAPKGRARVPGPSPWSLHNTKFSVFLPLNTVIFVFATRVLKLFAMWKDRGSP